MFCESLRPSPASENNEEATAESNLTNLLRTIQSQNQQIMEKLNSTLASDNESLARVEVGVMMEVGGGRRYDVSRSIRLLLLFYNKQDGYSKYFVHFSFLLKPSSSTELNTQWQSG